jgi:uncharacterized membrane protein YgdD (TMEM256/DUF423 family)
MSRGAGGEDIVRAWLILAGLAGALAVAAGAYLAHGSGLAPESLALLTTAQNYLLWHALALGVVAAVGWNGGSPALALAGWAFLAGIVLFSGGLALDALAGLDLGFLVPLGGFGFILGWLLLALAGWQGLRGRRGGPS